MSDAFGAPGANPTWTSSAKDLVTTALDGSSRIWLSLGHGIGNEIYWPSTGEPQVRDVGFIVVANGTWTEVKRSATYDIWTPAPAMLAPTVTHRGSGWDLRLAWVIDPQRDAVLVSYELTGIADALYVLVAPHLGAGSRSNTAWVDTSLHAVADGDTTALCVACDRGFVLASAGYVGSSDAWQDIDQNGEMTWQFRRAANGNVALAGSLPLSKGALAIALADTAEGATMLAGSALADGFNTVAARFVTGWKRFADQLESLEVAPRWRPLTELSAAVVACHEDRTYPGATVASLSVPWGNDRGDLGGYHLVWARDCVEVAFARLALGDRAAARRTLSWLCAAQQPDGHWTQNAYPDGRPYWSGIQLDEVALPILLAAALGADIDDGPVAQMVRRAATYLVEHGPASPQDRWEENAGTNAFTLATIVAGLLASTRWLAPGEADYVRSLARYWNTRIDDWLYVPGGPLCEGRGIDGYYVRIGRADQSPGARGVVDVRNQPDMHLAPDELIACDFLALVRFGLRSPGDKRIADTVSLIDDLLAVELPTGVAYRRYNGDGYGENADGSPFDGTGIGRPWPLLTGERGHYAAQAGQSPARFLDSMMAMTGIGNLLPEQVWDAAPIPDRFLDTGRPTGSAMPLAWAHAEFIKLATFESRGRPIEQLTTVVEQLAAAPSNLTWHWRADLAVSSRPATSPLLVEHGAPFRLRQGELLTPSTDLGLGRHGVTVAPADLEATFELIDVDTPTTIAVGSVANEAAASS